MSDSAFLIAPRRCVIGYGEIDEARAAVVDQWLRNPERARAERLKLRRKYWRDRVATLERELRRLIAAEKADGAEWSAADRAAWQRDVCTIRADLAAARKAMESVEAEAGV
jgi:hypothetical protein